LRNQQSPVETRLFDPSSGVTKLVNLVGWEGGPISGPSSDDERFLGFAVAVQEGISRYEVHIAAHPARSKGQGQAGQQDESESGHTVLCRQTSALNGVLQVVDGWKPAEPGQPCPSLSGHSRGSSLFKSNADSSVRGKRALAGL